ncbi:hypothetical protein [Vibrio agarivorans]|uniref:Uncharacterized protein n=1 Tax=Vibrio agarivorans TaxID=153622 RepID=A0ABT7Y365_9VIBR|nr:hypothetical protein [Vibrio agarivorans]MDN2482485.1 hypothetical protein [Vibrio agarivorans]
MKKLILATTLISLSSFNVSASSWEQSVNGKVVMSDSLNNEDIHIEYYPDNSNVIRLIIKTPDDVCGWKGDTRGTGEYIFNVFSDEQHRGEGQDVRFMSSCISKGHVSIYPKSTAGNSHVVNTFRNASAAVGIDGTIFNARGFVAAVNEHRNRNVL